MLASCSICFGGMAGCATIGQSVINVRSGGRGRLSCLVAGVVLRMVVYGAAWVRQIPMAALVAVMITVARMCRSRPASVTTGYTCTRCAASCSLHRPGSSWPASISRARRRPC